MDMSIPLPLVRLNQSFQVVFAIAALITGLYILLLVPLANGLIAVIFRRNLLLQAGRPLLLRRPPGSYTLMDADEQRFNQWMAVVCFALALIGAWVLQITWIAIVFTAMVGVAASIALLGFCVGCWIHYQLVRLRHHYRKA